MKKIALLFVAALLFALPTTGQEAKKKSKDVAPVTSQYTPKLGDVLTYYIYKDDEKNPIKRQWIVAGIDKKTIKVVIRDMKSKKIFHTEWSSEDNFLDQFLKLDIEYYHIHKIGRWTIPSVIVRTPSVESIFAMKGKKTLFPTLLAVTKNGKPLLRLVSISRQTEQSSKKKKAKKKVKKDG